jgi:hypothetical protein
MLRMALVVDDARQSLAFSLLACCWCSWMAVA